MKEITAHTGLRGVTALVVMFFHLSPDFFFAGFSATVLPYLFGNQAVDLFFVLSGFILCYVYAIPSESGPRGGYWNYHVARFARVYPLHFVTMAILGVMALVMVRHGQLSGEYRLIDLPKQVFLVNAYPYLGMARTWNYPAWSISIEYLAYLVVFPLFLLARPRQLSAGTALASIGVLTLAETILVVSWDPRAVDGILWSCVVRGVAGFLVGCLLHHVFAFHPAVTAWFQRGASLLAGVTLVVIVLAGRGWFSQWWLLLAWPPLVLGLTSREGVASRVLSSRTALFFGNLSYSVYLLHAVVGKMINATLYRHPGVLKAPLLQVAGVGFLLGIVLLAWLSFRFFEMPVRFWLRTRLNREPVSVGPPSAALAAGGEGVRHGHSH